MSLNQKIPESVHFSEKKKKNVIGFFGFQSIMRDAEELQPQCQQQSSVSGFCTENNAKINSQSIVSVSAGGGQISLQRAVAAQGKDYLIISDDGELI